MPDCETHRPLVTFALFAYNQEEYIREAVEGAFAQTYEPLEIILSDDCSQDDTYKIIKEMASSYKGPHSVKIRRSKQNSGLSSHMNEVAKIVQGDIIVVAAGDDVSERDRTVELLRIYSDYPNTYATFSGYSTLPNGGTDKQYGIKNSRISLPEIIIAGGGVQVGATYSYRRECFLWPFPLPEWLQSEDRMLPFRAALLGTVRYSNKNLVRYRQTVTQTQRKQKSLRIHGYNDTRHMTFLTKHVVAARKEDKISSSTAWLSNLLIWLITFEIMLGKKRNSQKNVRSSIWILLRAIRKIAVVRSSYHD